jgi:3-oxoacyl-[acyl-carrier protein] reductase
MIDLRGKHAIVTGGSRGIGAATARMLGRAGATVTIGYRSRTTEAAQVLRDLEASGVEALTVQGDLARQDANAELVRRTVERWGSVDIFVGNSGYWPPQPEHAQDLDEARWRHTFAMNVDSMFHGARAVIPVINRGGRLIFVSSTAGQRGEAGHADYAATKGAMISFVKSLAVELGPRDITVNAVAPGWVETEAVATPFEGEGRGRIEAAIPLGRVASTDDIAGPILFLASALARHVTGEILNVNGGSVLCG